MPYQLIALPCRTDNYIWLIRNNTHAWVVDPSLAQPVRDYIAQHGLILADILITHHHHDHIDGIAELAPLVAGDIIGDSQRIAGLTRIIHAPATFTLSMSDIEVQMLATPGHTHDHVSYHCPHLMQTGVLFCGDTLFSGGCGRVFDGTMRQLYESISQFLQLPDATQIACAHEYTAANLRFALAIQNQHLPTQNHLNQVKCLLEQGRPSLPSTLTIEKQINPYCRAILRPDDAQWIEQLAQFAQAYASSDRVLAASRCVEPAFELFSICRELKNQF